MKTTRSSSGTSQCHGNEEENENEILYEINFAIDVSLYTVKFQNTIIIKVLTFLKIALGGDR